MSILEHLNSLVFHGSLESLILKLSLYQAHYKDAYNNLHITSREVDGCMGGTGVQLLLAGELKSGAVNPGPAEKVDLRSNAQKCADLEAQVDALTARVAALEAEPSASVECQKQIEALHITLTSNMENMEQRLEQKFEG